MPNPERKTTSTILTRAYNWMTGKKPAEETEEEKKKREQFEKARAVMRKMRGG